MLIFIHTKGAAAIPTATSAAIHRFLAPPTKSITSNTGGRTRSVPRSGSAATRSIADPARIVAARTSLQRRTSDFAKRHATARTTANLASSDG